MWFYHLSVQSISTISAMQATRYLYYAIFFFWGGEKENLSAAKQTQGTK